MTNHLTRTAVQIFIACALYALFASTSKATDTATSSNSSSLAALLQNTVTLKSPGSEIEFGNFAMDIAPSGSAVPDISQLILTADHGALLWQIGSDRRVLSAGENYQMTIEFLVSAVRQDVLLTSSKLDMAGATIGTRGDATALITEKIYDDRNLELTSLTVREALSDRQLIDESQVEGYSQWLVSVDLNANGGADTGVLVLTDFETSFGYVVIPEPNCLLISATTFLASICFLRRPIRIN